MAEPRPMNKKDAADAVRTCYQAWESYERDRLKKIRAYIRGEPGDLYLPPRADASDEYNSLRRQAVVNYLALIVDTTAQGLIVDGYRTVAAEAEGSTNVAWLIWNSNAMGRRQGGLYRSTLTYGAGYLIVLQGDPWPVMKPVSAQKMTALYAEDGDEWPIMALHRTAPGLWHLYDEVARYTFTRPTAGSLFQFTDVEEHGAGVCPVIRYVDREQLDGDDLPMGLIEPVYAIRDQINNGRLDLLVSQKFASFRQRWWTGMEIPRDPVTKLPVEPFRSAVDRLWMAEEPDAAFGEFSQTDTRPMLDAHEQEVRDLSAISQVAPQHLLGAMANLSAEALAAAEAGRMRKTGEIKMSFGESQRPGAPPRRLIRRGPGRRERRNRDGRLERYRIPLPRANRRRARQARANARRPRRDPLGADPRMDRRRRRKGETGATGRGRPRRARRDPRRPGRTGRPDNAERRNPGGPGRCL